MASERATRALQRAEHTEQGRTEDWLRGWLPVMGTPPDAALAALVGAADANALAVAADALTAGYVAAAREHGASWAEVGHVLGLTRQGAQRRYGHDTGRAA
jgi:hypothetical protein